MNAFFIQDPVREEITWIGSLGIVIQHGYKQSNVSKIRFEAKGKKIHLNSGVILHAEQVERLTLANGKLTISEAVRNKNNKKPEVNVDLVDAGLAFSVRFVKNHLDMSWKKVDSYVQDSHGLIGMLTSNIYIIIIAIGSKFPRNSGIVLDLLMLSRVLKGPTTVLLFVLEVS